jgi:NAD(P)-dependent dehydrogenase (short-subunit alcohol dehydrogenase family)
MTTELSNKHATKIAIVTGGSRGLGRSTVINLARRGVRSIFTYNSNREEAQNVVAATDEAGFKGVALQLDVGDTSTFDAFAKAVQVQLAEQGVEHFNYLVNNAGISHNKQFAQVTEADLDNLYRVNFKGVFFITQKLLPLISDGGRIVNTSTGLTRFATPGMISYASLKGAIEVFTRHLAKELGPRGIAVNTVAPGAIATDFSGGILRDNPTFNKRVSDMTAMGRAGLPEDIGPMIASLLSDDNHWMTAQRIEVSGGMVL